MDPSLTGRTLLQLLELLRRILVGLRWCCHDDKSNRLLDVDVESLLVYQILTIAFVDGTMYSGEAGRAKMYGHLSELLIGDSSQSSRARAAGQARKTDLT